MKIRDSDHDELTQILASLLEKINLDKIDLDEDRKEWIRKYLEYHKTKKQNPNGFYFFFINYHSYSNDLISSSNFSSRLSKIISFKADLTNLPYSKIPP